MKIRASRCILWLALMASPVLAQKSLTIGAITDDGRMSLEVRSVFDPMPSSGYVPLRIVATNAGDRDTRWDFSSVSRVQNFREGNEHRGELTLQVPAHSTQSATFLAPMAVAYGNTSGSRTTSHQLHLTLNATGAAEKSFSQYDDVAAEFPAIAISKGLADTNHSKLKDEVESRSSSSTYSRRGSGEFFGSVFTPADLPDDWLGLSGFDYLMISSTEWQALRPGQQLAVMQWVRFYGQLHIYATSSVTAAGLGLPASFGWGKNLHSQGSVQMIEWDGKSLDASATVNRYYSSRHRTDELTEEHAATITSSGVDKPSWNLLLELGAKQFAAWQVVVFLVIFGILVGPINLFVLAPSGRRHRLFITTPLLSLGASVLMVGIILLQDGIGGAGARLVVVDVEPEEAAAYVTQKQVCRTGVLLGAGFEVRQPALIEPLALPDSPWVKLKNDHRSQPAKLSQAGSQRGGNFFQSRAEQAQVLRSLISTRARLELKTGLPADAEPQIISALGFTVDELYYVDAQGRFWQLKTALATGQQAQLKATTMAEVSKNMAKTLKHLQGEPKRRVSELLGNKTRSMFFALAGAAPGFTLDTLSSIRWQQDKVLVFGDLKQP